MLASDLSEVSDSGGDVDLGGLVDRDSVGHRGCLRDQGGFDDRVDVGD